MRILLKIQQRVFYWKLALDNCIKKCIFASVNIFLHIFNLQRMEKIKCLHCNTLNSSNTKYCINCGYELPKLIANPDTPIETTTTKPRVKKNNTLLLSIIALVIITLGGTGYFTYKKLVENNVFETVESLISATKNPMQLIANELNKNCPMMVDEETRLDKVSLPSKTVFQYNYTLINYDKSQIDTTKLKDALEQNIIQITKTNPQMQYQRDNNVTMNYFYNDKNGDYLMTIIISPEMYK